MQVFRAFKRQTKQSLLQQTTKI